MTNATDPPATSSLQQPTGQPKMPPPVAHHIHEFGELHKSGIVHLPDHDEHDQDDRIPVYGSRVDEASQNRPNRRKHASKTLQGLFRRRSLQQFFYNDVLFRHKQSRTVSREELFLDLVLVAAIATLGHHLREEPLSWKLVENFVLMFAVIYGAWRHIVLLWNYWGVNEDMLDKIGIYFTFVFIFGISLGAYDPFNPTVRMFVAISSFLASFIPLLENFIWARKDKLLKIPSNRTNTVTVGCILSSISLLPLLAAAFVSSERTSKNLFWASIAMQMLATVLPSYIVRFLHRRNSRYSRPAINIEHTAEKLEVLTLIFMGELVISLLSEGARKFSLLFQCPFPNTYVSFTYILIEKGAHTNYPGYVVFLPVHVCVCHCIHLTALVAKKGSSVGQLYFAGFLCTAMLYSFQTLYIQVDNRILRRGKHALRHDVLHGMSWSALHMPYHLSLVLLATGLGFALRDVAFLPTAGDAVEKTILRAADGVKLGEDQFTTSVRWLFSASWAACMIFSALLSISHVAGPRGATRLPRVLVRCSIAVGMMVGMPFTKLEAFNFLAIFAAVAGLLAIIEFVLVQLDRVGLFHSEPYHSDTECKFPSSSEGGSQFDNDLSNTDLEPGQADEDIEADMEALENALRSTDKIDIEAGADMYDEEVPDVVLRALQRRRTRGNQSRLVVRERSERWHKRPHALG